jgi:hypothetical protein
MFGFLAIVVFGLVCLAIGAYSHKWLAAEAKKAGIDPQSLADKVNADAAKAVKSVKKKV